MPDSRDVNEPQKMGKKDSRLEFSPATRKHLAAAAGYRCAIRGCLRHSTCVATGPDGTVRSANFGKASHIYAASPNGPRPAPPGMTPEKIKHHSNGIWTCSGCGGIVDGLECDYSPAQLFEMKRVREAAQKMAASDPLISSIASLILPIEFDEVFWNNLPNLEADKVRLALQETGAREILRRCERSNQGMPAPNHLPLKPLSSALKAIIEADGDNPPPVLNMSVLELGPHSCATGDQELAARRRAAQIVAAWAESIPSRLWGRTGWHIHHVNVLITARHPQTRVVCESAIRVVADGYGRHDHTADEGEVLRLMVKKTCSLVNNLDWQLDVAFEKGKMRTTSTLRVVGKLSPRNFHSAEWDDEFDSYERVLRKLAEGWHPIGFVDMNADQSRINDHIHPTAFEIEMHITAAEIDECLYRCSKIRLARALEMQWGWWFACTEDYFERDLDFAMIQTSSDELRAQLGPPPYWHRGESPTLVSVGRRDIKLVARDGIIAFKSVPRRRYSSS